MARPRKKKSAAERLLITDEPRTEWQKALAHLEENYKLYIAGAVFVLVCVAVGVLIRVSMMMKEQDIMTRYAAAALTEDASERLEKYQALLDDAGRWTPEVLYRLGETAIEAGAPEVARDAFQQVLDAHGASEYALHATDGLAFLAWNAGDLDGALAGFEKVTSQWPNEFIARRKHYDIGRIHEERGDLEAAVAAYQRQGDVFPESAVAQRAEQALGRLRNTHPELFPDEPEIADVEPLDTDLLAQTPYVSSDATITFDPPAPEEETTPDIDVDADEAVDVEVDIAVDE